MKIWCSARSSLSHYAIWHNKLSTSSSLFDGVVQLLSLSLSSYSCPVKSILCRQRQHVMWHAHKESSTNQASLGHTHISAHVSAVCFYFFFFLCILEMGEDSPDLALFFYGSIFREPHLHNMILQSTKPQWTLECGLVFEAVLFLHRQSLCNGVILLQLIYTSAVKCNWMQVILFFPPLVIIIQWNLHTIQFLWYESEVFILLLFFSNFMHSFV